MRRPASARLWCCSVQSIISDSREQCRSFSRGRTLLFYERNSAYRSPLPDWNSNDVFFGFTRGRFVVDEAENLQRRETRFDLNGLAKVAADSIGAAKCVFIKKYPDGMFNKVYLLCMEDCREVVAKVPNTNAGTPHFTTASEVATMDFVQSKSFLNPIESY